MRNRTFLNVSLGILALAMAYHFGASRATAQTGEQLVDIAWRQADGYAYGVSASGAIYASPGYCQPWSLVGHMPAGCVPACLVDGDVGGSLDIACIDGTTWTVQGNVPSISVIPCSSVFGNPTPTIHESMGSMKVRYRGEREPQGVKP